MYVIPLTLENLNTTGPLSHPRHVDYYIEHTKSGSFYFHTINCFDDEFVVLCAYKDNIKMAMKRCTEELASHSLKPVWGQTRRENQAWVEDQYAKWKAKRAQIRDPVRVRG